MNRKTLAACLGGALLALGAASQAQAQNFVTILTGGATGVYFPLGNAMSAIYAKALPNAKISVQATKASVENLNLIQQGRGEIGFTLGDSLSDAWTGNEEVGFKAKLDKLRVAAPLYSNVIHIVARADADIKSLQDLRGKRFGVGAAKSGTELNARAILKAAGLTYADLGKVEYLPFGQSVELMKNRQLDATLISAGMGVAAMRDLAASIPIAMVPVPAELVGKIGDPAYLPVEIPASAYPGLTAATPAVKVRNYLVTSADLPEATVYTMVKSLYDNMDQMTAAAAAAKEIDVKQAAEPTPVPWHPGAARYFREQGVLK